MFMRSLKDVMKNHVEAIKSGFTSSIFISNQLIHFYAKYGLLQAARNLFDDLPERNVYTWNAIISGYIKAQNLLHARELFDNAPQKDFVSYNSMLSGYVNADGYETQARKLFIDMQFEDDWIRFDEFTISTVLNLAAKLLRVDYGRQLHSYMVKTSNDLDGFGVSSLIDMYSKCGCFKEAFRVFNGCGGGVDLVSKNAMVAACCREGELDMALSLFWRESHLNDTVSWNTLISGFSQNGYEEEALKLFVRMTEDGVSRNEHTLASVLNACLGLKSLKLGKEIHAWILKNGFSLNPFIVSGIVDLYSKCGHMIYAELVHEKLGFRNPFSITSMIVGYSSQGNMVEARRHFDSSEEKNSVVWTALFTGYVKSQHCEAVFELLSEFIAKEAMVPYALVLVSVLSVCALQAALDPGKQIHGYIIRVGIKMDEKVISSIIDMYSKCGSITNAERVFDRVTARDLVLYNVMIAGYAHHGHELKAIRLYHKMLGKGLRPDAVTFIALLSACRHCGLVEMGKKYFQSMSDYGVRPEHDHYACMIDLFGRANELEKARAFIKSIPMELDAVIWGTFLSACQINRNAELAREAEMKLLSIEDNGARHVQLANVYAADGNWAEMGRIRKAMRGKEAKKHAGCSWIYLDSGVNIFTSGDRSHSKSEAIYSALLCLTTDLHEISRLVC